MFSIKLNRKKIIVVIAMFLTIILISVLIFVNDTKKVEVYAQGAVVYSLNKDKLIYEKNSKQRFAPASMTKLMSAYLVLEAVQQGKLELHDTVTVSERAARTVASKAGLIAGEQYLTQDLLLALFLPSGSDAVVSLAEHMYESEERFVVKMNEKSDELGLINTRFTNAIGLEQSGHYSTPEEIMLIAKALISLYPDVISMSSREKVSIESVNGQHRHTLINSNDMLIYEGVKGLKTGSAPQIGYNLTLYYKDDNSELIIVTMGNTVPYLRQKDNLTLIDYYK